MAINYKEYEKISDPIELYYKFKYPFFKLVTNNITDSNLAFKLQMHYDNYEFDNIRIKLDSITSAYQTSVLQSIEEGVSDKIYNKSYRDCKEVENAFMLFLDNYTNLIEINIQ